MEPLPDTQPMRPRQDYGALPNPSAVPPDAPLAPVVVEATPPSARERLRRAGETLRRWGGKIHINRRWVLGGIAGVLLVFVVLTGLLLHRAYDFGQAISNQPPFSSQLPGTGRVSLVFLGYGGPGHDGPYLTDSLLVVTYDHDTGKSALISVPRDLWVQVPPNSGHYAKLNTAYAYGVYNGGPFVGGQLATEKVTDILGINVPYWVSMDFTGFDQLVDKLGGVDINVPDDFIASESPSHKPAWPFHHGMQHMDGARALIFARARYCEPPAEASDFARSVRQQILMRALVSKMKSPLSWPAIPGVMDALQPHVHTNLSIRDLATIFTTFDFAHAKHIGLTNQNVLVDATSPDGQDILLPQNGDWGLIQQYVQQQLNQ